MVICAGESVREPYHLYRRSQRTLPFQKKPHRETVLCAAKPCGRVFPVGTPILKQKKPHRTLPFFRLLLNKIPFKRISEVTGITSPDVMTRAPSCTDSV